MSDAPVGSRDPVIISCAVGLRLVTIISDDIIRYSLLGTHFTRSCDVIDYVTNRFAIGQFLLVVRGKRSSISFPSVFSARQHAERAICYRPSVCPSVTRVDQSKTVERIIEILSPSDRPNILVFRHQRSLRKSDGFTPNGGAKYKGGSKN